jgi:hypothetical protein
MELDCPAGVKWVLHVAQSLLPLDISYQTWIVRDTASADAV